MVGVHNGMSESAVLQFSKTETGCLFKAMAGPAWINAGHLVGQMKLYKCV